MMILKSTRVAFAGLALALGAVAPAVAQHEAPSPATEITQEQRDEHARQMKALLALVLAHTDFEAVDRHFASLIEAHAAEIGGDTEALAGHVSHMLDHMAESGRTDPEAAAAHIVDVLMQLHMPDS